MLYNAPFMLHELCPDCRKAGFCWFRSEVDDQVSTADGTQETALVIQKKLKDLRTKARDRACPRVNYNPNYGGKSLL